jgi:hypothetical protein
MDLSSLFYALAYCMSFCECSDRKYILHVIVCRQIQTAPESFACCRKSIHKAIHVRNAQIDLANGNEKMRMKRPLHSYPKVMSPDFQLGLLACALSGMAGYLPPTLRDGNHVGRPSAIGEGYTRWLEDHERRCPEVIIQDMTFRLSRSSLKAPTTARGRFSYAWKLRKVLMTVRL